MKSGKAASKILAMGVVLIASGIFQLNRQLNRPARPSAALPVDVAQTWRVKRMETWDSKVAQWMRYQQLLTLLRDSIQAGEMKRQWEE